MRVPEGGHLPAQETPALPTAQCGPPAPGTLRKQTSVVFTPTPNLWHLVTAALTNSHKGSWEKRHTKNNLGHQVTGSYRKGTEGSPEV